MDISKLLVDLAPAGRFMFTSWLENHSVSSSYEFADWHSSNTLFSRTNADFLRIVCEQIIVRGGGRGKSDMKRWPLKRMIQMLLSIWVKMMLRGWNVGRRGKLYSLK